MVPVFSCDDDHNAGNELHPSLDDSWLPDPSDGDDDYLPLVPGSLKAIFRAACSSTEAIFLQVLNAKRLHRANDACRWKLVLSDSANKVNAIIRSAENIAMFDVIQVTKYSVKISDQRSALVIISHVQVSQPDAIFGTPTALPPTPTDEADLPACEDGLPDDWQEQADDQLEDSSINKGPQHQLSPRTQSFVSKFQPAPAKIDKKRKVPISRPPIGKKKARKKNGSRVSDVSIKTARKRLAEHPGESLQIEGGQLYCEACKTNVGSSVTACRVHCACDSHKEAMLSFNSSRVNLDALKAAVQEFSDQIQEETGFRPQGMCDIPIDTQAFRAETLEEWLSAGIEVQKIDKLRSFLERRCGLTLTQADKMQSNYLAPIGNKETKTIREEMKDQLVGTYTDGTTHQGEAFTVVDRWADSERHIKLRALTVKILEGSLDHNEIASLLIQANSEVGHVPLANILAVMNDSVSANLSAYKDVLSAACPYADDEQCLPHTGNNAGKTCSLQSETAAIYSQKLQQLTLQHGYLWHLWLTCMPK